MYMRYVYNMYKYETVSLVNREVPQLFRICGQSSAPRRKIGQRERICKASSRIISLLEGAFAPTTRKWWEEGGGGGRRKGCIVQRVQDRAKSMGETKAYETERDRAGGWRGVETGIEVRSCVPHVMNHASSSPRSELERAVAVRPVREINNVICSLGSRPIRSGPKDL